MATQAEIFRMSSFWRTVSQVRLADRMLVSRSENVLTRSSTFTAWSWTSR